MPHCVIEYSENTTQQIDPQDIVLAIHQAIDDSGLFISRNVRTRAIPYAYYHAGRYENKSHDFIHVTMHVLSGYSDIEKEDLTVDIVEVLQLFPIKEVLISCEVLEMSRYEHTLYVE